MSYEEEFKNKVFNCTGASLIYDTALEVLAKADGERKAMRLQLHDQIRRTTEARDQYNREVLGLNNEGDAIGGEPARGLKHYAEDYFELLRKLRDLIDRAYRGEPTPELFDEMRNIVDPPDGSHQPQVGAEG